MFYYIKGPLVLASPNMAVVEASGVAYKMTISENTYRSLPPRHTADTPPVVTLYTYLAVREDGIELFGFGDERELSSYKMLLSVSGVGPKAAMSILSLLTPEKFALAVCTEDRKAISKASGIGPKTAARIILELKDKLMKSELPKTSCRLPQSQAMTDAQSIMLSLGYDDKEIEDALARVSSTIEDSSNPEEILRKALTCLSM